MPSANTLVRWVNENAFAPIVRARPCPTFGRPVHHRGGPRRLRPDTSPHTLRIPPHDGHPVLRSAAKSGFRFTLAVSSFRLRARVGFSIPSLFSSQRDVNPAFGYSAPHLSAGGTSTLLNNALLSAHYGAVRLLQNVHVRIMGLSPSRTGLLAQTLWRSPGSRAHCVLTCLDSSTTPSPAATRDLARLADVAFPLTEKGRHSVACFRSSMIPPASPLSTLRYDPSRDHRQDSRPEWSRFSFSVGLSHPLQCAGLSRRSLSRISCPASLRASLRISRSDTKLSLLASSAHIPQKPSH